MSQTVRFEKQDSIAIVTIDRPEALNALNDQVLRDLDAVLDRYASAIETAGGVLSV